MFWPTDLPASIQASSTAGLNVEPTWYPPVPASRVSVLKL